MNARTVNCMLTLERQKKNAPCRLFEAGLRVGSSRLESQQKIVRAPRVNGAQPPSRALLDCEKNGVGFYSGEDRLRSYGVTRLASTRRGSCGRDVAPSGRRRPRGGATVLARAKRWSAAVVSMEVQHQESCSRGVDDHLLRVAPRSFPRDSMARSGVDGFVPGREMLGNTVR